MLFNSLEFGTFLPLVFLLYWFVVNKNLKAQNVLLLLASYFFYGWWDWRFLLLLILISILNYFWGIMIDKNEIIRKRKIWFITGVIINIGILGVFKYYNFFIDSFIDLVSLIGYNLPKSTLKIILPLGISFYTFLSLSFIIDIYRKSLSANRNIIEVLLTLSFFPIILAGPIQRPSSLLTQIGEKRIFNYDQSVDGLRQILWGLFMKIALADNLAPYTDEFFPHFSDYSGSTLLLGAIFYAVQIYTDFSGYSNIAIGTAKLFGFKLMHNFNYPYFSKNIAEFWKKWHISLTTWFRDYLFLPISFAISWKIKKERVIFIKTDFFIYIMASILTWSLIGLWHGANYTFIIWGMIHGLFLIIYQWQSKPRKRLLKNLGIKNTHSLVVIIDTIVTLTIVLTAWIFFKADNVSHALNYLSAIFSRSIFAIPVFSRRSHAMLILFFVILFFIIEWTGREKEYALTDLELKWSKPLRWMFYFVIILGIYFLGNFNETIEFIYFQF